MSGGLIIIVDEGRRSELIASRLRDEDGYHEAIEGWPATLYEVAPTNFSDYLSAVDWEPRETEICLLSFDRETIEFVALARRGPKKATAKYRVDFAYIIPIRPIHIDSLAERIGRRLAPYLARTSQGGGGRIPPATWQAVISAIDQLDPEASTSINRLTALRRGHTRRRSGGAYDVLAQEKDAVAAALDFAGMPRQKYLQRWMRPHVDDGEPAPFLAGLASSRLREDTMVSHDASVFGNWDLVEKYQVGAAEFKNARHTLTIMNLNRLPLEETLGVDLLYYHHTYRQFVMVQYKRMDRTHDDDEWCYRPIDHSYRNEIDRMRAFVSQHSDNDSPITTPEDWRLNSGPFFFKLCPAITFDPLGGEMLRGMYLPLDYWEALLTFPQVLGPRGGINVTHSSAGRWIPTTLFVNLVQRGLIGSRVEVTDCLNDLIAQSLNANHSVLTAEAELRYGRTTPNLEHFSEDDMFDNG